MLSIFYGEYKEDDYIGVPDIYFNNTYEDEWIEDEDSNLTRKIEQAVDKGRKNALWRTQYMKEWVVIQDARDDGFEDGMEQGIEQGIEQSIEMMLHNGRSVEEIVDFCGYSYELVKRIEDKMQMNMKSDF